MKSYIINESVVEIIFRIVLTWVVYASAGMFAKRPWANQ